jgi:protein ImuA
MEAIASGALPDPKLAGDEHPVHQDAHLEVAEGAHRDVRTEARSEVRRAELGRLLEQHPAIWRGRSVARVETIPTGFAALDECLPGQGWPRAGLVEILISRVGVGEMCLLLPALASLTHRASARWCAWISPPFQPFAPALAAHGVKLERLFVARTDAPSWAFEQSLICGACEMVMAWAGQRALDAQVRTGKGGAGRSRTAQLQARDIRRLQLAAEKGRTLGVLFRPHHAARESSNAVLRLLVQPTEQSARVTLLKSRGGHRGGIDLSWPTPQAPQSSQASNHPHADRPHTHGS